MSIPTLVIAGTHSGCGKTSVALALMAALARRGKRVQGFKVGPDFIDPGHHTRITGRPSRNLDTWLLDPEALAATFARGAAGASVAIIEGVMGLFDGRGAQDERGSTADLARELGLPVVLVVDARGMSRSIAALVRGYAAFDERVEVVGAIANRVGSRRHYEEYLAPALRAAQSAAPLGFLERNPALVIPERHLGLVTAEEFAAGDRAFDALADLAENGLDIDQMLARARAPKLARRETSERTPGARRKRVALARDQAFCFYYEDNLDLLRAAGAEIVEFSPLRDDSLPEETELVYLGGGYPELFAAQLAENARMRAAVRRYHEAGGALYGECGGMMACCESLTDQNGRQHPMWALIPARATMQSRFAALGYVTTHTLCATRLGPAGTQARGHVFHYSRLEPRGSLIYATELLRDDQPARPDGIQVGGLLAGYAHLHFGSNRATAFRLVRGAD
jgi:cobyrinic acid a,c-diamide synthase